MNAFILRLALVAFIGNLYLGFRIGHWFGKFYNKVKLWWFVPVYLLIPFAMFYLMFYVQRGSVSPSIKLLGNYWMGIYIYLIIFVFIIDLCLLIRLLIKRRKSPPLSFRQLIAAGISVVVFVAGFMVYGTLHARTIIVNRYEIAISKSADVEQISVALISDIHLGNLVGLNQINKIVNRLNEIKPDLVLWAGDIFDNNMDAVEKQNEIISVLRTVQPKYGSYAVFGNHDSWNSVYEVKTFLNAAGITLLVDEVAEIGGIYLIGRHYRTSGRSAGENNSLKTMDKLTAEIDMNRPVFVLEHRPNSINEIKNEKADVLFCGHTHAGQYFPANIATMLEYPLYYGHKKFDNTHVFVTSGAGVWGVPIRIGTDSEIMLVRVGFDRK